jgi:hypothetical protein
MQFRYLVQWGVLVAFFGLASNGKSQIAISNGAYQTHANGGFNNSARSELQASVLLLNTFGFGCQKVNNNRLADNFVVPAGARLRIQGLEIYAYQTSATVNTINECNFRIWNGAPNAGGSVIAGDPITNRFLSGTSTSVYRTDDLVGGATGSLRLIMAVRANLIVSQVLNSGTYWADWQMAGTLASGPWNVPVTILGLTGKPGANGLQFIDGAWQAAVDESSFPQDLAYGVTGSWLMNPLAVTTLEGTFFGGNLASLGASDNDRYTVIMDEFSPNSNVEFQTTCPSNTASRIDYTTEIRATRTDLSQFIGLFNGTTWETVDASNSSISDITRSVSILTNPQRFMLAGNILRSRLITIPQTDIDSGDGWTSSIDFVQWEVTP